MRRKVPDGENQNANQLGGEGGNETVLDLSNAEVKQQFDAAVATATSGLKENRDTILREKRELKQQFDELQAKVSKLGDLEEVAALMERLQSSEDAKLIAEGKTDEVVQRRTEALRRDAETRINAANEKVVELEGVITQKDAVISSLVIDASSDEAARKLECTQSAYNDIRRAVREVFKLSEEHRPEARDADGNLLLGKNAKDPLSIEEWITNQRGECSHWWPPSNGGGAAGGLQVPGRTGIDPNKLNSMSGQQMISASMGGKK